MLVREHRPAVRLGRASVPSVKVLPLLTAAASMCGQTRTTRHARRSRYLRPGYDSEASTVERYVARRGGGGLAQCPYKEIDLG